MSNVKTSLIFLVLLLPCAVRSSDSLATTMTSPIGELVQAHCLYEHGNKTYWWGMSLSETKDSTCNSCTLWYNHAGSNAIIHDRPYEFEGFGIYRCQLDIAGKVIGLGRFQVLQNTNSSNTLCKHDVIKSTSNDRVPPVCDGEGLYEKIQTDVVNEIRLYWCVDQLSGRRISERTTDYTKLPCNQRGMSRVTIIAILFSVQAVFLLIDIIAYFTFNEGFLARCIAFKQERDKKRYNALPENKYEKYPDEFGRMK